MEESKNNIDDLVKSIDSSFREMSLKDIVATHEEFFDEDVFSDGKESATKKNNNVSKNGNSNMTVKGKEANSNKHKENAKKKRNTVQKDSRANIKPQKTVVNQNKAEQEKAATKPKATEAKIVRNKAVSDKAKIDKIQKENQTLDFNNTEVDNLKKDREYKLKKAGQVGNWFQTFCYMNIPIAGFIYIIVLAVSKDTPEHKKDFARGYLLYKVLVWVLAIVLLYCLYKLGLGFVEGMLSFIKD